MCLIGDNTISKISNFGMEIGLIKHHGKKANYSHDALCCFLWESSKNIRKNAENFKKEHKANTIMIENICVLLSASS